MGFVQNTRSTRSGSDTRRPPMSVIERRFPFEKSSPQPQLSDEELKREVQRRRQQQLAPFGLTKREM